jgi:hypothetical protein
MGLLSNVGQLGSAILSATNENFAAGENTPRSLDSVDPGNPDRVVNFGTLGQFASKIDNSALRSYVETGSIRNIKPRSLEILMQEPDTTIVIKKRLFSSLIDNFKFDLMSSGDKLFIRAAKKLFQNKCQAISTYEKLTKIEQIAVNKGVLDEFMIPQILTGLDSLDALGLGSKLIDGKTRSVLETLRKVMNLSDPSKTTTWITDRDSPFYSEMGEGTGVFELTLVSGVNTNVSTEFGGGSCSLSIEDPYRLMVVTEEDIEKAITDALNFFKTNDFFRVSESELTKLIKNDQQELNDKRFRRGAPGIRLIINDDTILYRRIRAIIDEEGRELFFTYNPGVLNIGASVDVDDKALEGKNRLTSDELSLFSEIIKNTYTLLNLQRATKSQLNEYNQDPIIADNIRYVREKMTLNFASKLIIQPMDTVHVFMSSKSQYDDRVLGFTKSSFSGGIFNQINSAAGNIKTLTDSLSGFFGGSDSNNSVNMEKEAIVGADFPTWLWVLLRNVFTKQAAGVQQFSGIVDNATSSYSASEGKHVVSVSASDNTKYFSMGQINFKPSVDVFNGSLYDPLTPFKLDFDASSGFLNGEFPELLDENSRLLNSGAIKFKSGRFRGVQATEKLYKTKDGERVGANSSVNYRSVLNDPDGFVYRWKSGIGSLTTFGEPHPFSSLPNDSSPNLTKDPFAGQDVMNVLSLLITGQPYNYNTFVLAGMKAGNLSRDDILNEDGSVSYYRGLLADLTKQNLVWGNFIPFKQQVINERGTSFLIKGQFDIVARNDELNKKIEERAKFFDALVLTDKGAAFANNPQAFAIGADFSLLRQEISDPATSTITSDPAINAIANIQQLNSEISVLQNDLQNKINNPNLNDGALKIFGDDVSFDPEISDSKSNITEDQKIRSRREFRRKLNFLTQRRLWKVKANEDINLFIVDDQYDKNLDVQAFEQGLAGRLSLLQSEYSNVGEQIPRVAAELGLEVFADSQGHIKARPPGYNKVPSSVFHKMIRDAVEKGKRIFPNILERLFVNQIEGLSEQIEIVEDEIRLRAAVLGFSNDASTSTFLTHGSANANTPYTSTSSTFMFVTNESDGSFGSQDLRSMFQQSNPDIREGIDYKPLKTLGKTVGLQLKQTALFDVNKRIKAIDNSTIFGNVSDAALRRSEQIRNRLQLLRGTTIPDNQELISGDRGAGTKQVEVLNVVNEIARFVAERQSLLKTISNAIKNLSDGITLNTDPNTAKSLLYPNIYTKISIPDLLEHMIEDEETDDLGFGSGARYVIKESQIIDLKVMETAPPYTVVEVNGLFGEGFVRPPSALDVGSGGNAISTAFADDYDLWRSYGFKAAQPIPARSLSDPDSQLAPLAVFLLNKARKNILRADCIIAGNEYMQVGEVVYLEDRNLLFYVEQVSQSFSYSGNFTTSLKLTYGHSPGAYIPTMLDIVGKALYSKRHQSNLIRHSRHGHPSGETPITTLIIDQSDISDNNPLKRLVAGTFGDQNRKSLSNTILAATGILTPNLGKTPTLELRIYHNSEAGFSPDPILLQVAAAVQEYVINPSSKLLGEDSLVPDSNVPDGSNINIKQIKVVPIDRNMPQSPSSQAWHSVRNLIDSNVMALPQVDNVSVLPEEGVLFQAIIDVWVTFSDTDSTLDTSRNTSTPTNQNELDKQTALNKVSKGR